MGSPSEFLQEQKGKSRMSRADKPTHERSLESGRAEHPRQLKSNLHNKWGIKNHYCAKPSYSNASSDVSG